MAGGENGDAPQEGQLRHDLPSRHLTCELETMPGPQQAQRETPLHPAESFRHHPNSWSQAEGPQLEQQAALSVGVAHL